MKTNHHSTSWPAPSLRASFTLLVGAWLMAGILPAHGQCTQPPPNMVSWWPGDGDATDIQDGNDGTLQNDATFAAGMVGQAFSFDGTDDFVQVPNAANLNFERTDAFSIDAWILTTETTLNHFIVANRQLNAPFKGYALMLNNGQTPKCYPTDPTPPGAGWLQFFVDGSDTGNCPRDHALIVYGSAKLNDGQWHHVAATYDGSSSASGVKLYVDGALETMLVIDDNVGTNSILSTDPFTIGAGSGNGPQPFQGEIDEVEVFNRVLDSPEVFSIYNAGSFGKCKPGTECVPPPSNMVSWWPGDGDVKDIQDGNDGTLRNGATFGAGLVDQAFSFDGVDDFVEVPDADNIRFGPTTPMSVDFWIYRTSPSPTQHFIGKRVTCNGDGNGTFQMAVDFVVTQDCGLFFGPPEAPSVCSGVDLPMNTWTHLAGTFDGTTQRLYMNSVLIGQIDAPLGPANTAPLLIGGTTEAGQCGSQTTGGLMDEVEIFDRALAQSEIQAIVDAGSFGKCKPTGNELTLSGAVSRKTHGSAGNFDLSLVLDPATSATVEPRSGGPTQVIFTFSDNIQATDGTIDANEFTITNATFSSASISGSELTLNLTGVVDQSVVTIALSGIEDSNNTALTGDSDVAIRALLADATQNKTVDRPDYELIEQHLTETVNSSNFLLDLNLTGVINKADGRLVRKNKKHSVP